MNDRGISDEQLETIKQNILNKHGKKLSKRDRLLAWKWYCIGHSHGFMCACDGLKTMIRKNFKSKSETKSKK